MTIGEQYIEFVKSLGKPGELPPASKSVQECVRENFHKAFEWWKSNAQGRTTGEQFKEDLEKTIFAKGKGLKRNERGLIYLERALQIKNVKDLANKYYSVGECWAYRPGKAQAYCGTGGTAVKLKGWVDPDDVNWVETLYISTYHMASEKEIRLSDSENTKVEIFSIEVQGKEYVLDPHYIVRATAEKYSHDPETVEKMRQQAGTSAKGKGDLHTVDQLEAYRKYKQWQEKIKGDENDMVFYGPAGKYRYRLIKKGLKWSLGNKAHEQVTDQWWDGYKFLDDLLCVQKGNKVYYTQSSKNAFGNLKTVGKHNFVDLRGNELVTPWFDDAYEHNGNIYIKEGPKRYKVTADQIKNGLDLNTIKPERDLTVTWDDRDELKEDK